MKEQMRQLYKIILLTSILILQACGSSGDDTVFTISADVTDVSFSNEILQESTETVTIKVNFVGDGLLVGFAPDVAPLVIAEQASEPLYWLDYRLEDVTETSATIIISAHNILEYITTNDETSITALPANTYSTTLRLATSNADSSKFASHDVEISFLVWDLAVDTPKVKFNGTFGDTNLASQTINLTSDNTEWNASVDVDWLSLDVSSGTGNSAITITANTNSFLTPGLHQGNIILTEVSSGDTKEVPVELALDNIYLFADRPAVALTSTNNVSALETTLAISNNGLNTVSWLASTSVNWLTLTKIDDSNLKIIADPNLAPMNANSSAQIVISANQNSEVISESVTVNLYNSDLIIDNIVLTNLEINNNEIVTSPLLPVFYVGVGNTLVTYHQYTGEIESSLTISSENTSLEKLIIHPAGDYILARSLSSNDIVEWYKVSLLDFSVAKILDADVLLEPTDIVRLSGRYFVVTQALEFADDNLKVLFRDLDDPFIANEVDVAASANTLFALNNNESFKRYIPNVNDFGDDRISVDLTNEYRPELLPDGQFIIDFMVTNDEENIYAFSQNVLNNDDTEFSQSNLWVSYFGGENFVDNGNLVVEESVVTFALEKSSDNRANFLRFDRANALGFYLDVYNEQQNIISSTYTNGEQPRSFRLSADNQRMIINVDNTNDPDVNSQVELSTIQN